VLESEEFLGLVGERTQFDLTVFNARSISRFSQYVKEHELVILPGTPFKVVAIMRAPGGLTMVQLVEVVDAPTMIPSGPDNLDLPAASEKFYDLLGVAVAVNESNPYYAAMLPDPSTDLLGDDAGAVDESNPFYEVVTPNTDGADLYGDLTPASGGGGGEHLYGEVVAFSGDGGGGGAKAVIHATASVQELYATVSGNLNTHSESMSGSGGGGGVLVDALAVEMRRKSSHVGSKVVMAAMGMIAEGEIDHGVSPWILPC
jgi:hypothetical protein